LLCVFACSSKGTGAVRPSSCSRTYCTTVRAVDPMRGQSVRASSMVFHALQEMHAAVCMVVRGGVSWLTATQAYALCYSLTPPSYIHITLTDTLPVCCMRVSLWLQGSSSPLDLNIKILVIGLRGTGKTQLIHSLLGMSSSSSSSGGGCDGSSGSSTAVPLEPFGGGTTRVQVHQGRFLGVGLTLVDTPGLTASAAGAAANASILRSIKAAYKKHHPDLVLYVDRWVWGLCFMRQGGGGEGAGGGGVAVGRLVLSIGVGRSSWMQKRKKRILRPSQVNMCTVNPHIRVCGLNLSTSTCAAFTLQV
jgi:hypothetical protein